MPVRSLNSSVLKWPDKPAVDAAIRKWAEDLARRRPEILQIGYFGSYARGDWGVGSDVDLVIVVDSAPVTTEFRACNYDATPLPVPADIIVYSQQEFREALAAGDRWSRTLATETIWVYRRG